MSNVDAWVTELMMDFDIRTKFGGNKDAIKAYCEYFLKAPEIFEEQNKRLAEMKSEDKELSESEIDEHLKAMREKYTLVNVEIENN